MNREDTLQYKIMYEIPLTTEQRFSLFTLVSSGCHARNKERLHFKLCEGNHIRLYRHYGIYGRVYFDGEIARYCAGQSYPDEIRTLRECMLEE